MSDFAQRIDALTIDDLRAAGSLKWTAYPDAIGAWIAEMDFGMAEPIRRVLQTETDALRTGYAPLHLRDQLKAATSQYVADRYAWNVPATSVFWLPDVLTGLTITMNFWLERGSRIVVPTPCYMPFMDMPATFGHELVQLPMLGGVDDWGFDFDGLERAFADGAKLLVLCNPHNPIGKVYTRDELQRICEIVERHGGMVFSDEIHAPLTFPGHQHIPYASLNETAAAHTVTAMAASKAFNIAGLKCAQLVLTNPEQRRFYSTQGHGLPFEATPLGMAATIAAWQEGQPWLDEVIAYLVKNRELVVERIGAIEGMHVIAPQATYLALIDCRDLGMANPRQHFLKHGVALTDGRECGDAAHGFVRLNFATPRPVLEQALDLMEASLR